MLAPHLKRARSTSHQVASKWQESWMKYHLARSKKGDSYVFCTLCSRYLSIAGGVLHDIKQHISSVKRTQLLRAVQSQPSIASAMASSSQNLYRIRLREKKGTLPSLLLKITCLFRLLITLLSFVKKCFWTARKRISSHVAGQGQSFLMLLHQL